MPAKFLLTPLLLALLLAGCSDSQEVDPYSNAMSFDFDVNYDGATRGDDNDLYARTAFPTEGESGWIRIASDGSSGRDGHASGGGYDCFANEPEWQGKWWLEISLYEEVDGDFINRERWPIECREYWITVDENGAMELHEGLAPWARPKGIPGVQSLTVLGAVSGALIAVRRGRTS